jgi:hypothetical protein
MIYWHFDKGQEYRVKLMLRYYIAASKETCETERAELESRIRKLEMQLGFKPFHDVDLEA